MTVCISANTSWYLFNFRRNLLKRLIEDGYRVVVVTPPSPEYTKFLIDLGCDFIPIKITPHKINALSELRTILLYLKIFRRRSPEVVMLFTLKPVVLGSLACSIARIPYLCTVTGLGSFFLRSSFSRGLVQSLLRLALSRARTVFTQNDSDDSFIRHLPLNKHPEIKQVSGSGVDLTHFEFSPLPSNDIPIFLMIARLITDKGVIEFFEAARHLQSHYREVDCRLIGPLGVMNPSAISPKVIDDHLSRGAVKYLGEVDDVREHIRAATVIVLPSYREGLSRVLLEACAMGRPIITTDVPGCRETVKNNVNGYLCTVRDAKDLSASMRKFWELPFADKEEFGRNSREMAEKHFNENTVIDAYLTAVSQVAKTSQTL